MKRWVSVTILSLILVSSAAADDDVGKWAPASGSQRLGVQWAVNTETGRMRVCFPSKRSTGLGLESLKEFEPDSTFSETVKKTCGRAWRVSAMA